MQRPLTRLDLLHTAALNPIASKTRHCVGATVMCVCVMCLCVRLRRAICLAWSSMTAELCTDYDRHSTAWACQLGLKLQTAMGPPQLSEAFMKHGMPCFL